MNIIIRDITYYHNDRTLLFQHLNCSIEPEQHVNLVGNNGSGKSTLLKIMAGELLPAEGEIFTASRPYYVPQHFGQFHQQTIAEALHIDQKHKALQAILQGEVKEQYFEQLADDWDIEERVKKILSHWQLDHIRWDQQMHQLSGGEQTRVLLAGMQLHNPPITLLDEPTNHLDIHGREKLYHFIASYKGTLVVVSHDRTLLELNGITLALSQGGLEIYGGNYTFYKARHEEQLNALQQEIHHKEKELKKTKKQAQLTKERNQRQESRDKKSQAQGGIPRIAINTLRNKSEASAAKLNAVHSEKMGNIATDLQQKREVLGEEQVLQLRFLDTTLHKGKKLVQAIGLNYAYNDVFLWKEKLNFYINSGDRIAIRGANGSGKTTLLKLILGELKPATGQLERTLCETLYLDQQYSLIDPDKTVFEQLEQYNNLHLQEHTLKTYLHQYQLGADMWDNKCAQLSGGEKMKLIICCLFVSNEHPDMIILDEPGNNLDIKSLEILTNALKQYKGTLVLVSHDSFFLNDLQIEDYIDL